MGQMFPVGVPHSKDLKVSNPDERRQHGRSKERSSAPAESVARPARRLQPGFEAISPPPDESEKCTLSRIPPRAADQSGGEEVAGAAGDGTELENLRKDLFREVVNIRHRLSSRRYRGRKEADKVRGLRPTPLFAKTCAQRRGHER